MENSSEERTACSVGLRHGSCDVFKHHTRDVCRSCPVLGLAKAGLGVWFSGSCTLTGYETLGLNH